MKKIYYLIAALAGIIILSGFTGNDENNNVMDKNNTFLSSADEIQLKTTQIYKDKFGKRSFEEGWSDEDRRTLSSAGFNPDEFRPDKIFAVETKETTVPADSSDALSVRTYTGENTGDYFGWSVSTAGDVNGDGYSDVIVGAYFYNSDRGRVYIYYGSVFPHYTPDVVLNCLDSGSRYGYSVSSAGDVNGDGFGDVIVGACFADSFTGKAYIYYGGNNMDNTPDVIMKGETTLNYFGQSVSSAGDINADGYSDVIIGAYGYNTYQGRAYIYFGGASMDSIKDKIFSGEATGYYFGFSVSEAGDVNGDGYSDVIIGSYRYNTSQGSAYLYYGGAQMDTIKDKIFMGEATGYYFGYSVSTAGDVNGDGYSDVIIGAYYYNSYQGKAYIYYGGASMDSLYDVMFIGEATGYYFGISVSEAGDVNGDGYSDVIIGAYRYNTSQGRTYIYCGSSQMDNITDLILTGESTNNYFGRCVSNAGDVNGDGYSDVIIGAYSYSSNTGRAYVYIQSMTGQDIPDIIATGEAINNYFGYSVSTAGDVNADGFKDIIIGAHRYNTYQGRAYIFFGGVNMDNQYDVMFTGDGGLNYFGQSVSSAGDLNRDGYSDVIIGAYGYNSSQGRAYIYFGGSSMDTVRDKWMTGDTINNYFGYSVSEAGDVNGDGYSDVIIGARQYNSYQGRAYIYFGGSSMDTVRDKWMTGDTINNYFGNSVSTAGDVNGDGYSDVIIGAYRYNSYQGRAYIYFGGSSMDTIKDKCMTGKEINNYFGYSVSTAGDVNGDSYSDVIIGARAYNSDQGRAYIYYGGASMDTLCDVIMTGEAENNYFGSSVSTAGDINGDGYSDVIVGAYGYNSYRGGAYIFFGGVSMDTIQDVILTGEVNNSYFGVSVSSAGDINKDGYSDIVTGAYTYNSLQGRAYFYITSTPPVKPTLVSVRDVPKDQGGKVNITFARSGYDLPEFNLISLYSIERRIPPSIGWETMTNITPSNYPYYAYLASTPFDSGIINYRIVAKTSGTKKWYSEIKSGFSVDNLSPEQVKDLAGNMDTVKIALHWKKSTDFDLSRYRIYRNDSLIAEKTDTTMNDVSLQVDSTYIYRVAAVDIHGNEGPLSDSVQFTFGEMHLNLTVLIGGFYVPSNGYMSMKDTVMVYIRNTSSPYTVIDSAKVCLDSLGQATIKLPNTQRNSMYYVEVVHRNSLETWSTIGGLLFNKSYTVYDFTTDSAKAYGNNMIKVGTKWCIINGDCNRDNYIDGSDYLDIFNHYDEEGYLVGDTNGDMYVDGSDYLMIFNNYDVGGISPFGKVTKKRLNSPQRTQRKVIESQSNKVIK